MLSILGLSICLLNADVDFFLFFFPPEEELRKLREETNIETLKQELEKERIKRLDLEQKMNEVIKVR